MNKMRSIDKVVSYVWRTKAITISWRGETVTHTAEEWLQLNNKLKTTRKRSGLAVVVSSGNLEYVDFIGESL